MSLPSQHGRGSGIECHNQPSLDIAASRLANYGVRTQTAAVSLHHVTPRVSLSAHRASGNFSPISDEEWLTCLRYAVRNPVLRSVPGDDPFSDDGYQQHLQGRAFSAAWKLLIVLDATDRHAAILSDAFLSIAVFSAPYDEMLKAAGVPAAELTGELSIGQLSDFSEKYEQGTRL